MFKNTFQSGFLSILYSIGSKPLQIWDKKVRNGHIKRITDQDIQVDERAEDQFDIYCVTVIRPGDRRDQREHHLHHVPRGPQEDSRYQAALPRHDCEEHEEILHVRGPGPG